MTEIQQKVLEEMPIHSTIEIDQHHTVMRVPGGYIYETIYGAYAMATFVPEPAKYVYAPRTFA